MWDLKWSLIQFSTQNLKLKTPCFPKHEIFYRFILVGDQEAVVPNCQFWSLLKVVIFLIWLAWSKTLPQYPPVQRWFPCRKKCSDIHSVQPFTLWWRRTSHRDRLPAWVWYSVLWKQMNGKWVNEGKVSKWRESMSKWRESRSKWRVSQSKWCKIQVY